MRLHDDGDVGADRTSPMAGEEAVEELVTSEDINRLDRLRGGAQRRAGARWCGGWHVRVHTVRGGSCCTLGQQKEGGGGRGTARPRIGPGLVIPCRELGKQHTP